MHNQIFISYSRKDQVFALKLYNDLFSEGYPVWIDQEEIKEGEKWRPQLDHHIRKSNRFIVLVSNHSSKSPWVNHEGSMAFALGHQLLPVQIEEKLDKIPVWAEDIQLIDFYNKDITYGDHYKNLKQHLGDSIDLMTLQRILDQTISNHAINDALLDEVSLNLILSRREKLIINEAGERLIEKSIIALENYWNKIGILENRVKGLETKYDQSKEMIELLTEDSWYSKYRYKVELGKYLIEIDLLKAVALLSLICIGTWVFMSIAY